MEDKPPTIGFFDHFWLVFKHAFKNFSWGRDLSISTAIALLGAVIQIWGNTIPQTDRKILIVSIVAPYIVVFSIHLAWKLGTAPWKLYQELERENYTLRTFKNAVNDRWVRLTMDRCFGERKTFKY